MGILFGSEKSGYEEVLSNLREKARNVIKTKPGIMM